MQQRNNATHKALKRAQKMEKQLLEAKEQKMGCRPRNILLMGGLRKMADVRLPQGDEMIESKLHSHHSTAPGEKDSSLRRAGLLSHRNHQNTGSVPAWDPRPPAENQETT